MQNLQDQNQDFLLYRQSNRKPLCYGLINTCHLLPNTDRVGPDALARHERPLMTYPANFLSQISHSSLPTLGLMLLRHCNVCRSLNGFMYVIFHISLSLFMICSLPGKFISHTHLPAKHQSNLLILWSLLYKVFLTSPGRNDHLPLDSQGTSYIPHQ